MIFIMIVCQKRLMLIFPLLIKDTNTLRYNARLASRLSYSLPRIRTNYGKFNIRYSCVKVWNENDEKTKKLKPARFKMKLKQSLLDKKKYLE